MDMESHSGRNVCYKTVCGRLVTRSEEGHGRETEKDFVL